MNDMIEVPAINTSGVNEYLKFSESIIKQTADIVITNDIEQNDFATLLKVIKARMVEMDAMRKNITRPLDLAKKNIMDLFRTPFDRLEVAEQIIKEALLVYYERKEAIRRAEEAKLLARAEAERKKLIEKSAEFTEKGKDAKAQDYAMRAELVQAPVLPETDTADGISFREVWDFEIIDSTLIPREWLIPNSDGLKKMAIATKGTVPVPGIKFFSKKIVTSKAAK